MACNLAGPRRIKAGAARDHFLGFQAVSGRGEAFKAGGRVVKNVTGYDMMKLLAGSHGTLAAMTDLTVKVLPAPEKTYTVLLLGLDDATAGQAHAPALASSHEVSGAAHLPADAAAGSAVCLCRCEPAAASPRCGSRARVPRCCTAGALRRELADLGPTEELHSMNSAGLLARGPRRERLPGQAGGPCLATFRAAAPMAPRWWPTWQPHPDGFGLPLRLGRRADLAGPAG